MATADNGIISDEALIERTATGDMVAFDELARRWFPRIVSASMANGHQRHTAEDIAQESLLRVMTCCHQWQKGTSGAKWLNAISYNMARNFHSKPGRRGLRTTEVSDATCVVGIVECDDPATVAETADTAVAVNLILDQLDESRQVVVRRYAEGVTLVDICREVGLSVNPVKQRLNEVRSLVATAVGRDLTIAWQ